MLTEQALRKKALRFWPDVLKGRAEGMLPFPWEIQTGVPSSAQMLEDFQAVREWAQELRTLALKHNLKIIECSVPHRRLGTQSLPQQLVFEDRGSYLSFIKKEDDFISFERAFESTRELLPELLPWLKCNLSLFERHLSIWHLVLKVARRYRERPFPNVYLRQLDIPEVDTKFVETHHRLLRKVLKFLLDGEKNDDPSDASLAGFCRQFGFRIDEPLVRFRWLDESITSQTLGLSDLTVPLNAFAAMKCPASRIFITENKINGLCFPAVPDAMVIFGLGFGIEMLSSVEWMKERRIFYWGDIDTHGFAMVARLRQMFPKVVTFLMDAPTFHAGREFWVREPVPESRSFPVENLTAEERALFEELRTNVHGVQLRFEQERIPMGLLDKELSRVLNENGGCA